MNTNGTAVCDSDIVGAYRPRLAQLADDLVRVDLEICAWRGTAPISPADLGLEESEEFDETLRAYLRLGRKRLLPPRYGRECARIESRARETLRQRSYDTELGFLVPKVRWPALKESLLGLKEQYDRLAEELTSIQAYPLICEEIDQVYMQAAVQAWKIRQGLQAVAQRIGQAGISIAQEDVGDQERQDAFIEDFRTRILQTLPSPEAIRQKFSFRWTVRYLELPSRVEEELRQTELSRLQLQAERERLAVKIQQESARDTAEQEQQRRELASLTRRLEAEEAVAQEVAEKTKAELEAKYAQASTLVESTLRSMLYDLSVDALSAIQKNGSLPGASAQRIRTLIERVRFLNYRDTADVEALVKKLEQAVPANAKERNPENIVRVLRDIGTVTRAELVVLGETPRSGVPVAIADVIPIGTYRNAREALRIDLPVLPSSGGQRSVRGTTPSQEDRLLL